MTGSLFHGLWHDPHIRDHVIMTPGPKQGTITRDPSLQLDAQKKYASTLISPKAPKKMGAHLMIRKRSPSENHTANPKNHGFSTEKKLHLQLLQGSLVIRQVLRERSKWWLDADIFEGRIGLWNSKIVIVIHQIILQWLFLVPLKGGRWHIILQLAVYTTYILPSGGLYATYHLLGEPETTIEYI